MTPTKNPIVVAYWKMHRKVLAATRGRVGAKSSLLLTTTGRTSGEPRDVALWYLTDDGRFVVVASNLGQDDHPLWFRNLEAQPKATVTRRGTVTPVEASVATGDEADRLFDRFLSEVSSAYADYRERTDREIPIVILTPV